MNATSAASGAISAAMIGNQISTAIAAKGKEVQQQQGEAILSLVQEAAALQSGLQSGDPTSNSSLIDVRA